METTSDLLTLARRLPVKEDSKNLDRLRHAEKYGHIILLKAFGNIIGYAELYRVKEIPSYPVIPYPVDDAEGKILYCFAAVAEKGFIKDLIKLAFETFPEISKIVYHRRKHGNKTYQIKRF